MNSQNFMFDCVMIVDDTKIDRYIASHVMKKHFFAQEVIEFDMATKAIKYLEENLNSPEKLPQIIVLDIRMPEMDGFQFLERLSSLPHAIKKSCCIIMLSSSLDPLDLKRVESNAVVKKFINKPLGEKDLQEVKNLFQKSFIGIGQSSSND